MDKDPLKQNPLVFSEKPYYTDEELELYYRIAIDEAMKQGNDAVAAHYRVLLELRTKDEPDPIYDFIVRKPKE